ncbi:MAG: response regulator transcription factor [Defluviitaleaceae bacterium]|nr:response regulator transcription factor [Defluviitaleaceae bacterium]
MNKVIYILEDDESIREIITYTLTSSGFTVFSFSTSKEMYEKINQKIPNIILLDIMLSSSETGIDIIKRLKTNLSTKFIPVIFLTAKSTEIDKAYGLDIGADDYITKPFGVLELVARVKAVLRRYEKNETGIHYKDIFINLESKQLFKSNEEISLTFKEFELFMYLYENIGVVISRDSLLDKIWGMDFFGERRTVDVHIRALRQKLSDSAENPIYIKTIRGYGYMLVKE